MRPLLELNNISYSYHTIDGETKALSDISFQLAPENLPPLSDLPDVEIHTSFVNRRTYRGRERNNLPRRRTIGKNLSENLPK